MDMAFLRRAERHCWTTAEPARLDHALLMAALAAQQSASAAGRPRRPTRRRPPARRDDPLIELLLAGPGWRRAAVGQRGCFSRAEAGRRINAP